MPTSFKPLDRGLACACCAETVRFLPGMSCGTRLGTHAHLFSILRAAQTFARCLACQCRFRPFEYVCLIRVACVVWAAVVLTASRPRF